MISICIPAYNAERFIARTIDSIVEQTIQDKEVVVIDDGSTDKTREIVEKYCEKYNYIKYYYQENQAFRI